MNIKLLLIAASFIVTTTVLAQEQSGTIIYNETITMNVKLDGDAAQFAHL